MMRMVPSTAHPENNLTTHIVIDCVHALRRHGHLANEAGRIEIRSRCLRKHPDRPQQNVCFSADMRWSRMLPCLYTICQTRHIHDETGIAANSVPVIYCNSHSSMSSRICCRSIPTIDSNEVREAQNSISLPRAGISKLSKIVTNQRTRIITTRTLI